jgi:hypothetical protein
MSDTDSFIDEVTEEVRRDRLFAIFRRYGWIAVVVILVIVGGAAYTEWQKARDTAQAETLGDAMVAALELDTPEARAEALAGIEATSAGGAAMLGFMTAAAQAEAGETDAAVAGLTEIASTGDLPEIYRQIAAFKAITLQADTMPVADRRQAFEALAAPGAPLRLLAEEQLALIAVEEGDGAAAIARFQSILDDAEVTSDLQQRASQAIVALGGVPQSGTGTRG